jgi:hypothetical protein
VAEDLEDADAEGMGQRLEEPGLEGLEVHGGMSRRHQSQYIDVFIYSQYSSLAALGELLLRWSV